MSRALFVPRHMVPSLFRPLHTSQKAISRAIAPSTIPISVPLPPNVVPSPPVKHDAPLARLPPKTLARSLILTSLMGKRWFLQPALAALGFICNAKLAIFNVDRNPVLNRLLRLFLYDQYAAGATAGEVAKTTREIKGMGYNGVILGYAKEVVLQDPAGRRGVSEHEHSAAQERVIEQWKDEQIQTLRMIDRGDFLAVKLTGAGDVAIDALRANEAMPASIMRAMDEICDHVRGQGSRVWIDAEQQAFQPTLDNWTIDLMRKHNRDGEALVYNTIQAYLKGARANANRHVRLAAEEGWTVGVKLVRGAYIENEVRALIHDTKADTDQSYDDIADMFISQVMPRGSPENLAFPSASLFLATHNAASAAKAAETYQRRRSAGLRTLSTLECGQVHGMADELSCSLLQEYEDAARDPTSAKHPLRVYKCLTRGTVSECLGYLYRRAVENRGAVERTEHMQKALAQELRRRLFG